MILKRKKPQLLWQKLGNYIWPFMGWGRFLTYVRKRITRLSGSPHRIALGIALGVACSFNPFVGTHIIQAAILSLILRAHVAASALGTIIGNPTTFPFMWWSALLVGQLMLKLTGYEITADLVDDQTSLTDLLQAAQDHPMQILLPWAIGGYILGAASLPITYLIVYPLIKASQAARHKIIQARKSARK